MKNAGICWRWSRKLRAKMGQQMHSIGNVFYIFSDWIWGESQDNVKSQIQGSTSSVYIFTFFFQEKLLHVRLLQGMFRRAIATGRSREDPNMDQATSRSGTRGLGSFFSFTFMISFLHVAFSFPISARNINSRIRCFFPPFTSSLLVSPSLDSRIAPSPFSTTYSSLSYKIQFDLTSILILTVHLPADWSPSPFHPFQTKPIQG